MREEANSNLLRQRRCDGLFAVLHFGVTLVDARLLDRNNHAITAAVFDAA